MKFHDSKICIFESYADCQEYMHNVVYFEYDLYLIKVEGEYHVIKCRF